MVGPNVARRFPLWTKLAFTAFVAVLVRFYLKSYGPTNFLYFCDVALLMAVVAIWTERSLWASMPAVGILVPQAIWCVDFLVEAFGGHLTGMTDYMFDEKYTLFTRALSFFHFWLPFLLLWMVWVLGYDRRAFLGWTALAMVLLVVCWMWMPAPPAPNGSENTPVNINYVYGMSETEPQTWIDPRAWFALLLIGLPALVFFPTHLMLKRMFSPPCQDGMRRAERAA